jgi:hypothetical protein
MAKSAKKPTSAKKTVKIKDLKVKGAGKVKGGGMDKAPISYHK